jgi:ABC-type Mn2+/Zn2+ transport system ATPase subunit
VLLVATHDARQARAWQQVLCLNGVQIAYGVPSGVLTPEVLQATYGGELVVLADGTSAVAVEHHEH